MITKRQEKILSAIVEEYIRGAEPVSSGFLEKKYQLDVCSSTIRNEMNDLAQGGYICQPYTSAGRIPTDKGYRFFVDKFFDGDPKILEEKMKIDVDKDIEDSLKFTQAVTRFLAMESLNLAVGYLSSDKFLCKEGWVEILQEPEFEESGYVSRFARALDDFEKGIEIFLNFPSEVRVYVGKENPVSKIKDFSIVTLKLILSDYNYEGVFAILGPKRMSYNKNINLLQSLNNLLK